MTAFFPPLRSLPVEESRAILRDAPRPEGPPIHQVENRTIPGPGGELAVRIYRPGVGLRAVIVYFHGGGWVVCDLDSHDRACRSLADATGATVVSVDYRLAPEHPFPAAADDGLAATSWVAAHADELGVDPNRLAVAGDSAGGNLAAAVPLMARAAGGPRIAFQLGIYPVLAADFDTPSYRENAERYFLTRSDMEWFWDQYVPVRADRTNPIAAPLSEPDLTGLPPSHIITAEHDPLRDEGAAYANRLREAGVPSTNTRYGGMFHGFFAMGALLPTAEQAFADVTGVLRRVLGEQPPPGSP